MAPDLRRDQRRGTPGRGGAEPSCRPSLVFGRAGWSFVLVFCLYAYQGLVAGFALTALSNHHAALGASGGEVAWHAVVVGAPWVLQPAWGPMVDRFGDFRMGRRRFWVVAALAGSIATLLVLLLVEDAPGALTRTSWVLAAHGAFAALLDTAADALVIDRIPPERLGRTNACTRAGFLTGTAVGAAVFASVLPEHGLHAAAALLAGAGAAALIPALLVREDAADRWFSFGRRRPAAAAARRSIRRFLAPMCRREALVLIAFCLAVEGAVAAVQLRTGLELIQKRGWDAESLSRLQAGLGLLSGTAGAFAVGWWSDRLGALRGLAAVLLLGAAGYAALALLLAAGVEAAAATATALAAAFPVLVFVALAPAVMRASRGPGAATRFALFMASLNLGGVGGNALAGAVGTGPPLWMPMLAAGCAFAACAQVARHPHLMFRRGRTGPAPA